MRSPEVFWLLGILIVVLCVASLIGFVLQRRNPASPQIRNLNARIRPWWILIPVGFAALFAGPWAVIVLFALLSVVAAREFGVGVWVYASIPLQYAAILSETYTVWLAGAVAVLSTLLWKHKDWLGYLLCVYGLSHVPALMTIDWRLMVFLVLITQISDVLQYIWGKALGRHAVAPSISPGKTVEGLVGGVLSATAVGAMAWRITPFGVLEAGAYAFVIGVLGFVGGLILSAIKRKRGIKDWGKLMAGHGGVLDRLDSLCISAPVFFFLVLLR